MYEEALGTSWAFWKRRCWSRILSVDNYVVWEDCHVDIDFVSKSENSSDLGHFIGRTSGKLFALLPTHKFQAHDSMIDPIFF
jgi:hypothetical protein